MALQHNARQPQDPTSIKESNHGSQAGFRLRGRKNVAMSYRAYNHKTSTIRSGQFLG